MQKITRCFINNLFGGGGHNLIICDVTFQVVQGHIFPKLNFSSLKWHFIAIVETLARKCIGITKLLLNSLNPTCSIHRNLANLKLHSEKHLIGVTRVFG
jgi:hypothetical protein